ncbi:MAG TPA: dihydrofolate reductase family protein [Patescibacteria group bacterium]|nr:dihydrofolate reductase family protein [Patescibacteria group bacterium]
MNRITIQSGGNMNAELIRNGLVERVSVVVAPCIVGGKDTTTLVDGESLQTEKDLRHVKTLVLQNVKKLKNSYLHLVYKINT